MAGLRQVADSRTRGLDTVTRCPETCKGGIGANAGHGLVLFSPLIVVQLLFSSLIVVLLFSEQQNNNSIGLTFGNSTQNSLSKSASVLLVTSY